MLSGVYKATKKDNTVYYRASVTHHQKHISLGSYATESEASKAYFDARRILEDSSYTLQTLNEHSVLPYGKQITLLNFRDHDLYFANPIYLRKQFFEYHYSPEICFRFDIDDLFYFSSHKIMVRGNHFFVADYGMQTNILSRFGIRSFAVCGRDYIFENGDRYDFRRQNLTIINRYYGVTRLEPSDSVESSSGKSSCVRYRAKIHINGDYIIGTYQTEEEAAIAYNKAIDLLIKKGVTIQYTPNYLEGLAPSVYAKIYSELSISNKLLKFDFPSSGSR